MHAIPAFMIIHADISDLYRGKWIVENGPHNGNKLLSSCKRHTFLGKSTMIVSRFTIPGSCTPTQRLQP